MKLLTRKDTDPIFKEYSITDCEMRIMLESQFNSAVNVLLMDPVLVKKLLKKVKYIKKKLD